MDRVWVPCGRTARPALTGFGEDRGPFPDDRPTDDPHPSKQTARIRRETGLMIDAFRKIETELHFRLIEMTTIPSAWNDIHERRAERHPKRTKVTANFDADVVRFFKGLGPGYQWRMNEVLRAYMHGRLARIVEGPDTTDYILHPERIPDLPESWHWGDAERELREIYERGEEGE